MSLPIVISFWHGPFTWLEKLSVSSFLHLGHEFQLYAYEDIAGLPPGCVLRDASSIVERAEMFYYKNNRTPAVFADYFRLKLLERSAGLWADCDMVCLRPLSGLGEYVFGYEKAPRQGRRGFINNAVLRLPPGSALLRELIHVFSRQESEGPPPWLDWQRRLEFRLRHALGQNQRLNMLQFGATGPYPLTYFAHRLGLESHAQARPVFYPLDYAGVAALTKPGARLTEFIDDSTLAIHLWRMGLTERGRLGFVAPPEPGSALFELCEKFDVQPK